MHRLRLALHFELLNEMAAGCGLSNAAAVMTPDLSSVGVQTLKPTELKCGILHDGGCIVISPTGECVLHRLT